MARRMSSGFHEEVMRCLSADRMRPYLSASGGVSDRALRLYQWNIRVSAALFELLATVEVVVRNALHEQLTTWNSENFADGNWFENRHGYLLPRTVAVILDTEGRIRRECLVRGETTLLTMLPFGFWRYLLSNRYRTTLWPFATRNAFPHLARSDAPKLFKAMAQLHVLRNRVAHHEPIHRRDLAADYAACRFVLGAVSPEVAVWATADARIPELLAQRP